MRLEYFQLIDRIVHLDAVAKTVEAEALVPAASTVFEGHFPTHPLMPGVLLIETMAQASGWLIIGLTGFQFMPFLAAVQKAKLRRFVTPGERLEVKATLEYEGSGQARTRASIAIDGKRICDAELAFRTVPFPTDAFRQMMAETARRVSLPVEAPTHG